MAERGFIQNTAVSRSQLLSVSHNPGEVHRRRTRIDETHVKKLNDWVRQVRESSLLPQGAGATVPWFDPNGGGENAGLLFLMQDPSEVAYGTGFISPDNDDYSARNATVACRAAGLPAEVRVHWNVFPHWVNVIKNGSPVDPTRPPQTYAGAKASAVHFLGSLLQDKLPRLRVVVLLGKQAQDGWRLYRGAGGPVPRRLKVLSCPSTSPQAWNNRDKLTGRPNSGITIDTLKLAAGMLDSYQP
ncbi:MAG: hypothetical protein KY458_02090 [Actinobacteria bacterium]|nr:hypothetical protein [Actinomycetota bacterium]